MSKISAIKGVVFCLALAANGCAETNQSEVNPVNPNTVSLTAASLQTKEMPATARAGQNYVYCLGCLSPTFAKEVMFARAPTPVAPLMAASSFKTQVSFVEGVVQPGVKTAESSISVNSHS